MIMHSSACSTPLAAILCYVESYCLHSTYSYVDVYETRHCADQFVSGKGKCINELCKAEKVLLLDFDHEKAPLRFLFFFSLFEKERRKEMANHFFRPTNFKNLS